MDLVREAADMPVYDRSPSTDLEVIDRWPDGVGWVAHPDEGGKRASHAVSGDDGVWVIDPVDAPGVDELLDELGDVIGVVVLCSYHARDAGTIANRYDVAVHVPEWMDRVAERVDAPVERFDETFGSSGFRIVRFEPLWISREAVAYRESDGTLIAPDLLSSSSRYTVGDERLGVMLPYRLFPPRERLGGLDPERILFGHGEGVFEDASGALNDALDGARKRFPRAFLTQFGTNVRFVTAAMRE